MTVIKKFVSILLAASLCFGSFFSVQGDTAFKASAYQSDSITSGYIDELLSMHSNESGYQNAYSLLHGSYWNVNYLCVFTYLDDFNWNFTVWRLSSYNSGHPATQWQINIENDSMKPHPASWGYLQYSMIYVTNGQLHALEYNVWRTLDRSYVTDNPPVLSFACGVNDAVVNSSTYKVYFSNDIYTGSGFNSESSTIRYAANLIVQWGPPPAPDPESFDLIRFQLGSRTYLTTSDQAMIRAINPDTEGLEFYLGYMFEEQEHLDHINYSDLQVIQGAEYMIADELVNISPIGVYCYDISNLEYDSIFYAKILGLWYDEWVPLYAAANLPLNAPSGPGDVSQPYDDAWEQIINYYNTYNTTHVVPQNLGDTLFGLTGSQTAACWVSLPDDLVVTGTTSPQLDTIQWGFNDLDPSIDFSLMDVLVFPAGAAEALVEYYYNKSFTPSMVAIDRFAFSNLLNLYDVIIIVDSEYTVGSINPFVVSETGGILHHAFTGLSSGGMDYIDAAVSPWPEDQTYHGFCFITKKAIQKQQLFNFNDGITKTYDLMVQYIDKRDSWDDSFLLWSSSVFDMLNSLDGRLSKIEWFLTGDIKLSDYLNNILDKLDNLVNNTSVDEVTPDSWYASLWRFVKRFDVQDSIFANWLDDLDDFYDDLPDLPEVQPTIIPFPTYIPVPTEEAG